MNRYLFHDSLIKYKLKLQANNHFECFSHRCAFLMIALENIAFQDELPHNKQAALGAAHYIGNMLDEMEDIQAMLDAVIKTQQR